LLTGDTDIELLTRRMLRRIDEARASCAVALADGMATSFDDYRHMTGQIEAYTAAAKIMGEELASFGQDEDDS
jgi:hypothetical protein